jgi:hypothetical protein
VLERGALLLPEAERAADSVSEAPGTVLAIDDEGLEVATSTGSLLFPRVLDADGQPLTREDAARLGIEPGVSLALSEERRARLTQLDAELAKHEPYWTRRLSALDPAVRAKDLESPNP